ncbi:MAG: UvrD-helicase domain-containing protein, partial [Pyrinomonadaceae bacterium]
WLCAPPGASGSWRELTPQPGSLFVVGDPKQSIYRFRGADIAAYDAVRNGPLAGEAEQLIQNFRSSDELLHWLNRVFDRVLEEREGVQPENTHLYGQVEMAAELGRPPIVVVREEEPAENVAARRRQESELLAKTISRAVRDEHWRVRDRRAQDEPRDVEWRDVAILVPSRTGIEGLEAALQRYGVPYRFEGGRGFFSRQEVRDLVSVLHAVDDPTDAISLVAALRSLAFGCSDDDLMLWSLKYRFDYRGVGDEGPGPESVRQAMIMLRKLSYTAPKLSLGELVRVVIGDTGLAEAALSLPSGRQAAANVMKLLDQAREFSAAGNGALRAFTGWLARMRDEEAQEIPDAPVAEERDDAVRVMTIHAAKGLEFPVVCLGNLESTGSNQPAPVPDAPGHAIELKIGSKGKRTDFCTPEWEDAAAREKNALQAERDRLLYVACTRARDHLVIPVTCEPGKERGYLERLIESIDGDGGDEAGFHVYEVAQLAQVEEVAPTEQAAADDADVETAAAEREEWLADRDALVKEAGTGIKIETASSIKEENRPIAAQREAPDQDTGPTINVEGTPPLELGDAFHRVMERVSLPDGEDLEQLAKAICAEAQIPDVQLVIDMARRCLDSDIVRRALVSGDMHREIPFVIEGDDGRVIVGRMDLLFRDGDDVVVVDYKTDRDEKPEAHRAQVQAYAQAVHDTLGVDGEVQLLYARSGEAVPAVSPA